jgi:hypothetical protein
VLVGLVILLGSAGSAEARIEFINTEDQILDLGVMPDELREYFKDEGGGEYDRVGFYYKRFAILGADVWSWSGQLVFFRQRTDVEVRGLRTIETTYYIEIDDETAERYGWSTPIEYRIPIGLLVAACVTEFAIVARKKRRAKRVLAIGIGLVALAAILYFLGMTWQIAFPLLLGVFHIVIALPFFHPVSTAEAAAAMDDEPDPPFAPKPAPEHTSGRLLPPPPNVETDPFRAPPQPPPIAVNRPPTAPTAAPVVRDDNADAPKLLR